ncbi:MAG: T9SS type A sorting domain-containing protein [Flavobacterium sp.]|nr:T9SS type A sorting domain-containing protein [Flavobacterium sp.]
MKKITFLLVLLLGFASSSYAQFPTPYCGPLEFQWGVEPITRVNLAGINNVTLADLGGPEHEDFTAMMGSVDTGGSYPAIFEGNTGGNYVNYFAVYADWNQDGDFDDVGETYEIGSITNSTGLDGLQVSGTVVVPATALPGSTRMRIVKSYFEYTDACNSLENGYGQAEDYTVTVVIPTCVAPSNGTASITSSTEAQLSWTSAETNAAIVVQPAGTGTPSTADGTGEEVTGTTYTATGLTAMTAYEFYVRNDCGTDGYSSWSGPHLFNTTLLPGCASNPSPAMGAIDVPVGPITLTWDVPATGDMPTSYDLYVGNTADDVTTLVGNYTTNTTGTALQLNGYNTVVYWMIVPKNIAGSATGCSVWSFTTEAAPGYCLASPNGQWPGGTTGYTPAECDGVAVNQITTAGFAGEYSLVNVTAGQTYTFSSSIATDFITVSNADGTTSFAADTTPLTWVSTITGQVRFYTHVDNQCTSNTTSRTRSIVCGVPSTDEPDYANLQWPATINIDQGGSDTVYGQVYEGGLTDVAPNIDGQAPGISAWVGISPEGQNTDPSTWTNWIPATHNAAYVGNNDEYMATIGANLTPGTYYYATRFRLNNGGYVYGGYANGFWDGTANISGVLTVAPPVAPANDECSDAISLIPGGVYSDNVVDGTTLGATDSSQPVPGTCFGFAGGDVWYSAVVPASGSLTIETGSPSTGTGIDTVVTIYSGSCGTLTQIGCDDDGAATGNYSMTTVSGVAPGSTIYLRVYEYNNDNAGPFAISVYDASLSTNTFDASSFAVYPNPVKDVLNLSYTSEITSVTIFNLLGQQVSAKNLNATSGQVDMSTLPSGAYILKVSSGDQIKSVKVIKE